MPLARIRPGLFVAAVLVGTLTSAGCHGPVGGDLTGIAQDEWTRSYTLSPGGTVEITNRNGHVEVEGAEGTTVEVSAERIAKALTDAGARELLPRIVIDEESSPDRVSLVTEGIEGMLIGAAYEVRYRVKVPRDASLRIRVTNGNLDVQGINGAVTLTSTNGSLSAEGLGGGVEARSVNGKVSVGLTAVGDDPVDVRSTNGGIELTLPAGASATLMANVTNGNVDVSGVSLEEIGEQSRRRVRGRLNGGGTPVELTTVNGNVRVSTHP